jgi:hypothetical protein
MSQVEHEFYECVQENQRNEALYEDVVVHIVFYCETGLCRSFAGACCFMMYLMWYGDNESLIADLQSMNPEFTLTGSSVPGQMNLRPFVLKFGEFCRTQHTGGHAGFSHPMVNPDVKINLE